MIKEILSGRIIEQHFLHAMEEIRDKSQENFKDPLRIESQRFGDSGKMLLLSKVEKNKKVFLIFPYMKTKRSTLGYLKIMDEEIICGVGDPILLPIFKEEIAKVFKILSEQTEIKKVKMIKYFEQAPDEMAAK